MMLEHIVEKFDKLIDEMTEEVRKYREFIDSVERAEFTDPPVPK